MEEEKGARTTRGGAAGPRSGRQSPTPPRRGCQESLALSEGKAVALVGASATTPGPQVPRQTSSDGKPSTARERPAANRVRGRGRPAAGGRRGRRGVALATPRRCHAARSAAGRGGRERPGAQVYRAQRRQAGLSPPARPPPRTPCIPGIQNHPQAGGSARTSQARQGRVKRPGG
ncbi:MAG: hypothetical protein KAJ55_16385 [Anaerolineales bacterium]|nr:hypothetical protein [Anaerolineales bacterium]